MHLASAFLDPRENRVLFSGNLRICSQRLLVNRSSHRIAQPFKDRTSRQETFAHLRGPIGCLKLRTLAKCVRFSHSLSMLKLFVLPDVWNRFAAGSRVNAMGTAKCLLFVLLVMSLACQPDTADGDSPAPSPSDAGAPSVATDAGPLDVHDGNDSGSMGPQNDGGDTTDASLPDAALPSGQDADGGPNEPTQMDAGALTGCAAEWQTLAQQGGPQGIFNERGNALLPDCAGTRQQEFSGIERVVFVGDSVTVGTPPANLASDANNIWGALGGFFSDIVTDVDETYRSRLADHLAERFSLNAPGFTWRLWDPFDQGEALQRKSGDFWNCARWGSKTDDLWTDGEQIANCFPNSERDKRTLVVFTIGGNDLVDFVQMSADGDSDEMVWQRAEETITALDAAVMHLKDPNVYPAGNLVLFATPFEYTDWFGDITSCAAASASGLSEISSPTLLQDIMNWLSVEYLRIAESHGADVVFLLEEFCGHGFRRDDPSGPCYRGEDAERWFDLTCIHPNAAGHAAILNRFQAILGE